METKSLSRRATLNLNRLLGSLTSLSSSSGASAITKLIFKCLLYLILLANIRAIPGGWHWRVFWPLTKYRLQLSAFQLRTRLLQPWNGKARTRALARYIDETSALGVHPFDFEVVYRSRVSVDESDFNMHMSNSSYPKILDLTRTKMASHLFPHFVRAGGVVPIAATHFHFIRELPMLAKYHVRAGIGAWDEKWLYVVANFITNGKTKANSKSSSSSTTPLPQDLNTKAETEAMSKLLDSSLKEDEVLHTVAVARCCFKSARITVPPAVLLTTQGVCVYPSEVTVPADLEVESCFAGANTADTLQRYSATNPPPSWTHHVKDMVMDPKRLRAYYQALGWRQDKSRWCDSATGVGGPVDEKRKERLEICRRLFDGMNGVREFGEK